MTSLINDVHGWLKRTYNLSLPREWIQNHLERAHISSFNLLTKAVFSTFLHTDIGEFKSNVTGLPRDTIASTRETALSQLITGSYCVQIEKVIDISRPAYSQMRALQGVDETNIEATETTFDGNKYNKASKPSSSNRMCELTLNDGTGDTFTAIEYEYIPDISVNLKPGCKIVLHDKIKCRRGLLMLKKCNIKVVGGEVKQLCNKFSQLNVLSLKLGLDNQNTVAVNEESNAMLQEQNQTTEIMDIFDDDDDEGLMSLMDDMEAMEQLERNRVNGQAPGHINHSSDNTNQPNYTSNHVEEDALHGAEQSTPHTISSLNDLYDDDFSNPVNEPTKIWPHQHKPRLSAPDIQSHKAKAFVPPFRKLSPSTPVNKQPSMESFVSRAVPRPSQSTTSSLSDNSFSNGATEYVSLTELKDLQTLGDRKCLVKAFILTLLGRLSLSQSKSSPLHSGGSDHDKIWHLKARLTDDGSQSIDVTLSNDFLVKILKFTATEMRRIKKHGSDEEKSNMTQSMGKCRDSLIGLCGTFSIEIRCNEIFVMDHTSYSLPLDSLLYNNFLSVREKQNIVLPK